MDFKLGDKFASLADLQTAITNYSKKHFVDLHKRDSRTLEAAVRAKKISADRCQKKELKYYSIKYACVFGGRDNFKGRGDGSRKTKTFQRGCPFSLQLSLSSDGLDLEVTNINSCHENLDQDENEYDYLPKVRKLTTEDWTHASENQIFQTLTKLGIIFRFKFEVEMLLEKFLMKKFISK